MQVHKELRSMEVSQVTLVIDKSHEGVTKWYEVVTLDESLDGPIMTALYTVKFDQFEPFMASMGWSASYWEGCPVRHQGIAHL